MISLLMSSGCANPMDRNGSSEEDVDVNNSLIDPQAEDRELKDQLLCKYSGYLGSLKQEFMKKRKKGKLPKEARQQLLDWWSRHYKWPYPSVSLFFHLSFNCFRDNAIVLVFVCLLSNAINYMLCLKILVLFVQRRVY